MDAWQDEHSRDLDVAIGSAQDPDDLVDIEDDTHAVEEVQQDEDEPADNDEDETDSQDQATVPKHPFPHLREIGHLASWTVSSHKLNCGVRELRSPSIGEFWQSDGPQPHMLTIHFFKRVTISHMRLHVDHDLDESYTPTRIQIWAGTAHHDLQLVTDMPLEDPKGWLDIDLSSAGGPSEFVNGEEVDDQAVLDWFGLELADATEQAIQRRRKKLIVGRGPTLRCFIVQVFAKDHEAMTRRRTAVPLRIVQGQDQSALAEINDNASFESRKKSRRKSVTVAGIKEADWMGEMTIR